MALRIALLAPVWFPVPPQTYGGIERVVATLADELVVQGYDVTLFASGDSQTLADVVSVYDTAPSDLIGNASVELRHALACYESAAQFDIIGDHSGPVAAALAGTVPTPVVHTVHGPLDGEQGCLYQQIARVSPGIRLISLSDHQRLPAPDLPWLATCPNAIDPSLFAFQSRPGSYLVFVGRMTPDKGCHHAIRLAREAGMTLLIAAKCREPLERAYFAQYIEPQLGGGIEYLGELAEQDRTALLRSAYALVFPIQWREPFGMVMLEALACGTPVLATRRGAVPEVIRDGVTGVIVDHPDQLLAGLARIADIDRYRCREDVVQRFRPEILVANYLAAFRHAIGESQTRTRSRLAAVVGWTGQASRTFEKERSNDLSAASLGRAPGGPPRSARGPDRPTASVPGEGSASPPR